MPGFPATSPGLGRHCRATWGVQSLRRKANQRRSVLTPSNNVPTRKPRRRELAKYLRRPLRPSRHRMPHPRKRRPRLRHLLMKPSLRTGRIANSSSSMPRLIGGRQRPIGSRGPASPFVVQAGTIIPAALITGIRSDLPGQITAQVTENIFDTPTGRARLIPQGAKLIGIYDSQVAFGQSRVLLVWTRLIMPNGRSIVLERQQGADARWLFRSGG